MNKTVLKKLPIIFESKLFFLILGKILQFISFYWLCFTSAYTHRLFLSFQLITGLWSDFTSSNFIVLPLIRPRLVTYPFNWKQFLKGAQVWDFWPIFFTPINPIWVGNLRTGEKKKKFRRPRQIFAVFFTQAEPALKNCLRRLSLR